MSWLLGAASGAGDFLAGTQAQALKQADATDLENLRASNDQARQMSLMRAQEDIKNAPLNRFASLVAGHANDTVPTPGDPQAAASGLIAGPGDQNTSLGNAQTAEANGVMPADGSTVAGDLKGTGIISGGTRKLSKNEMIEAGLAEALANGDGVAYAAGLGLQNTDAKMMALSDRSQYLQDKVQQLRDAANDKSKNAEELNQIRAQRAEYEGLLKASQAALADAKAAGGGFAQAHERASTDKQTAIRAIAQMMESGQIKVSKDGTVTDRAGNPKGPLVDAYNAEVQLRDSATRAMTGRYSDTPAATPTGGSGGSGGGGGGSAPVSKNGYADALVASGVDPKVALSVEADILASKAQVGTMAGKSGLWVRLPDGGLAPIPGAANAPGGGQSGAPAGSGGAQATPAAKNPNVAPAPVVSAVAPTPQNGALAKLVNDVQTAQGQLVAANKSGDRAAINQYTTVYTTLKNKLQTEASRQLGDKAPAYLASLGF